MDDEKIMSQDTQDEPLNSKVKVVELDYKIEYFALLEHYNDIAFQIMLNYKSIKAVGFRAWMQSQQQNQIQR